MRSRTATALVGLLLSLGVSAVLYYVTGSVLVFLFLPFVPFLLRGGSDEEGRQPVRECPECGFRTHDPSHDYCPHDGTRLDERPT